jgi:methylisocitrate lyase
MKENSPVLNNPDPVEALKKLISDNEITVVPGTTDALTANIALSVGFEAIYLGGYATGAVTAITEPLTTMTEISSLARNISHSVNIPLIVDGNAGFGNPVHTYRTVQEYINSGISGIHIEDQVYPKRMHYHQGHHHITDTESMMTKIEVANEARRDSRGDIILIARSDANRGNRRKSENISDAVERINRYFDAGADVGMLFPRTWEELEFVAQEASGPMTFVLSDNFEPRPTTRQLDSLGYAMVIYPTAAPVVITKHIKTLYQNIKSLGETGLDPNEYDEIRTYIEDLIQLPRMYEIEESSGLK